MATKQTDVDGSGVTAQELIKSNSVHLKFGNLRKKKSKLPLTKWPSRFIVVVDGCVYIFEDDHSSSPKSVLSLLEFNRVEEDKFKKYKWCFSLVGSHSSDQETARVKTFACSCESEREQWKLAIGFQIYIVENSHKPPSDNEGFDSVIRYYRDDNEYSDLANIHQRRNTIAMDRRENKASEGAILPRYNRSQSVINTHNRSDDQSSSKKTERDIAAEFAQYKTTEYCTLEMTSKDLESSHIYHEIAINQENSITGTPSPQNSYTALPKATGANHAKRELFISELKSATLLPKNYLQHVPPRPRPQKIETEAPPIPPRCRISTAEEQNIYDEYNSQNSLEAMSSMTDNSYDHQKLKSLLQGTQQTGTYLIRNSRQGWEKVLSYLSQNGQVKEYKIFNFRGKFTLDHVSYFDTISSMLEHYSSIEPIPNTREYLKLAIHQIVA